MKKDILIAIIWLLICYLLASFVFMSFFVNEWNWGARASMIILWVSGLLFLEKK